MNEHERAGFDAALRGERRAWDTEDDAAADAWRRGWDAATRAVEGCVDVIRDTMHTWSRTGRELDALHRALGSLRESESGRELEERIRKELDGRQNEAWHRIRPALRKLIAAVREADRGTP